MATYTVTNSNSGGAGSLSAAIQAAEGTSAKDTIVFAAGLGPITVTSTFDLTTDISFKADTGPDGLPAVVLTGDINGDGKGDVQLFRIEHGAHVSIAGLALTNGYGDTPGQPVAGAIVNYGSLQIASSQFSGNTAIGSGFSTAGTGQNGQDGESAAGAIYNAGSLALDGVSFNANNATAGGGGAGGAGADGVTTDDPGGAGGDGGRGGDAAMSVLNDVGGTMTMTGVQFTGSDGEANGGMGGAGGKGGEGFMLGGDGGDGGDAGAISNSFLSRGTVSGSFDTDLVYGEFGSVPNSAGGVGGGGAVHGANGHAGAGTLFGSGGYVVGTAGDDFRQAPNGRVEIDGLAGDDTLNGGSGADTLLGGADDDVLFGGLGNDTLVGGSGDDVLKVSLGSDLYNGADDTDTLDFSAISTGVVFDLSGPYTQSFTGGSVWFESVENVTGGAGADTLTGIAAGSVIDGGKGADSLIGGAGNDTFVVDDTKDRISDAGGQDLVRSAHSWTLAAGLEDLTLTGSAAISGTGNAAANLLTGNSGANVLNGKAGADTMVGGAGDDTYYVDDVKDVVKEAGGGTDLVISTHSFSLAGQALENLTLTGSGDTSATGNSYANHLIGNSGANLLNGAGGAETMEGGAGNDTYVVDNVKDVVKEAGGGVDLVMSSHSFSLAGQALENLTLTGTGATHGDGNSYANVIIGNSAANQLDGGLANDTMTGGAGHDYFLFDTALGPTNIDRITDFSVADDTIRLGHGVFTGLKVGTLSSSAFHVGAAAGDTTDRIIYDDATGKLFFDDDGTGGHAAKQFATIAAHLALTSADFVVV